MTVVGVLLSVFALTVIIFAARMYFWNLVKGDMVVLNDAEAYKIRDEESAMPKRLEIEDAT